MHRNTLLGLIGTFGIWLTAGLSLPFVNVLNSFSVEQLMIARGLVTALLAAILLRITVLPVDRYALLSGLGFAGGCLGLYHGIRELGPSLTIVVFTTAPVINFIIAWYKGRHVSLAAIVSLILMLGGVAIALEPWGSGTKLSTQGLLWCIFGTISGALYFEALSKAHEGRQATWDNRLHLCFWQALIVGVVGMIGTLFSKTPLIIPDGKTAGLLIGFALVGGFLYFLSYIEAFAHLPIDAASVLAQGETPAVILMSGVIVGDKLNLLQWLGVAIALYGAWYLSRWLSKQASKEENLAASG